jgi:hypothetical protein
MGRLAVIGDDALDQFRRVAGFKCLHRLLDRSGLAVHVQDIVNDAPPAFRSDTAFERDRVGQCLPATAALPAQPGGGLHLRSGGAKEVENASAGKLERAMLAFALMFALGVIFEIRGLELGKLGLYIDQALLVVLGGWSI